MRKQDIKITKKEAKKFIPLDEFYCNDTKPCPYFELRVFPTKKAVSILRRNKIDGIPVGKAKRGKITLEYCNYLKKYLSIQDGIKDCGINTDED